MSALHGKRIVVTRPRRQAAQLCASLAALGATPIQFPTIAIAPTEDTARLDLALARLERYHWLILTSVNGVNGVWLRLDRLGRAGERLPEALKVAVIGPATAAALVARGVRPHLVPERHDKDGLLAELGDVGGLRILMPQGDLARDVLATELERRGAAVDTAIAYRTLPDAPDPQGLAELRRGADMVTFASASAATNFIALVGADIQIGSVACIGPLTAQTARDLGLSVAIVAADSSAQGLIEALEDHFARYAGEPGQTLKTELR